MCYCVSLYDLSIIDNNSSYLTHPKEYLIDDTKEQKLYDELYKEVKVSKGDKTPFADLFKR